jgi:cytochrome c oxidase subunit 2
MILLLLLFPFVFSLYLKFFSFFNISFCDAAEPWQISPQDPATTIMEWMVEFHNFIMCDMIFVTAIVIFFLYYSLKFFNSNINKNAAVSFTHDSFLEIAWTAFPAVILVGIAFPSFGLLYALDDLIDPTLTLKIIGHQWYWSYEYGGSLVNPSLDATKDVSLQFDSYMIPESDLSLGRFRLLEVDNRIKLPVKTHIRLMITSSDVLHSWTIPSFGVKVDACPGRLSQASVFIKRCGVYYGQCSELCGVNHGFMPIVVEAIPARKFINWLIVKSDSN